MIVLLLLMPGFGRLSNKNERLGIFQFFSMEQDFEDNSNYCNRKINIDSDYSIFKTVFHVNHLIFVTNARIKA